MAEILAPAGDEQSAYAAINSGADAIYLGLTAFSARSSAKNFDFSSLEKLIGYAHILGVKIYVAMNTLVKQSELPSFIESAVEVHNLGADAIIIQDLFLGKYLKEMYPQMKLHLSTQAGVCNVYGARLALKYGFDRVILARETPLAEIEKITKIIQTEVFVQGALCTCFSGQCYLSSFAGGNSGNRGKCKQPCRKLYSIDREGFESFAYRLSLSDLSVGNDIDKLLDAGVYSFKIEGRMRRPEYVAAAVSYYRAALDGRQGDLSALKRTYNRGNYTHGLAFGQDKNLISSAVQGHIGEYCGTVCVTNGKYLCRTAVKCADGDAFKILREGKEVCGAVFGGETKGGFFVTSDTRLKNGDKVFITTDARLNQRLLQGRRWRDINLSFALTCGERIRVTIDGHDFYSDFLLQPAQNRPVTERDVKNCFDKTDKYPLKVHYGDIEITGESFVPTSALNAFRRETYENHAKILKGEVECIKIVQPLKMPENYGKNAKIAAICSTMSDVNSDICIVKPDSFEADGALVDERFKGEKYLFLPSFLCGKDLEQAKKLAAKFDGIYCDGYYAVELCEELGVPLFAGTGFNVGNGLSLSLIPAKYVALSKELTVKEAQSLTDGRTFYLTAGDIKVMDLLYCPFSKTCRSCDRRTRYTLTDGEGRRFPMRRYTVGDGCRFEIYNCASLVGVNNFTGVLVDCTLQDARFVTENLNDTDKLKKYFKNYTKGHTETPVL